MVSTNIVLARDQLVYDHKSDHSFQILHAFYILERTLDEFNKRAAVFDVVFWEGVFRLTT